MTRLCYVDVLASDISKLAKFYMDVFGFKENTSFEYKLVPRGDGYRSKHRKLAPFSEGDRH